MSPRAERSQDKIGRLYRLIRFFAPRQYLRLQALQPYHYDEVFDLFSLLCSKEKDSIDIGVNRGLYAYWLAQSSHRVHCFEPNPVLISSLQRELPKNCILYPIGLSDKECMRKLFIPDDSGLASVESDNINIRSQLDGQIHVRDVHLKTLDSFNLDNVGFLKIDVEGHEIEVLSGAIDTIRRCCPRIYIEIKTENRFDCDKAIFQLLGGLGYSGFILEQGLLKKVVFGELSTAFFLNHGQNVLFLSSSDSLLGKL